MSPGPLYPSKRRARKPQDASPEAGRWSTSLQQRFPRLKSKSRVEQFDLEKILRSDFFVGARLRRVAARLTLGQLLGACWRAIPPANLARDRAIVGAGGRSGSHNWLWRSTLPRICHAAVAARSPE